MLVAFCLVKTENCPAFFSHLPLPALTLPLLSDLQGHSLPSPLTLPLSLAGLNPPHLFSSGL